LLYTVYRNLSNIQIGLFILIWVGVDPGIEYPMLSLFNFCPVRTVLFVCHLSYNV